MFLFGLRVQLSIGSRFKELDRKGRGIATPTAMTDEAQKVHNSFLWVGEEAIAYAADGLQVDGGCGVVFDVSAETDDEVVDGAGVGVLVEIPDVVEDGFAGDRAAGAADEVTEKFSFH